MIKADIYFHSILNEIIENGIWSKEPRTRWSDGSPAYYKSIKQKNLRYNILDGEFPVNTIRKTALRGAFYDIEAIYIKQTNLISEMHPSIHSWWLPFVVKDDSIGQTYGHTVKRYDLMNRLLFGMEHNPEGRRHIINLWQEQQMIEDPAALVPCAYLTEWSVEVTPNKNFVDQTLIQRSMDFLMTSSINPAQYVMLGMMVCNHLTWRTKKHHVLRMFEHHIQDIHIYDRHMMNLPLIKAARMDTKQPEIKMIAETKDFYAHNWQSFKIFNQVKNEVKLNLEIAI
ncbi:thymidylate synthase [uncultured Chryseobacterium sp.]|uniref:thymidylate synthase n=1 Tax=uncultured Chryseobacterium sp. TaxID=259322 RepID=UPI0025E9256D|nr:thymidylate synthase [uncultured Chryseobacterium sp.]